MGDFEPRKNRGGETPGMREVIDRQSAAWVKDGVDPKTATRKARECAIRKDRRESKR